MVLCTGGTSDLGGEDIMQGDMNENLYTLLSLVSGREITPNNNQRPLVYIPLANTRGRSMENEHLPLDANTTAIGWL